MWRGVLWGAHSCAPSHLPPQSGNSPLTPRAPVCSPDGSGAPAQTVNPQQAHLHVRVQPHRLALMVSSLVVINRSDREVMRKAIKAGLSTDTNVTSRKAPKQSALRALLSIGVLRQQGLHDFAVDIGETEVPARVAVCQPLVVEAQRVQQGRL